MSAVELPWRRRKRERAERIEARTRHDLLVSSIVLGALIMRSSDEEPDYSITRTAEGYTAELDEWIRNLWSHA